MDETTRISNSQPRLVAGRYELRGLLGRGGMADVELAYDRVLDREVAIKLLHQRFSDNPSFVERFRREAQAAASLTHPNVVGVYDTGEDRERPYIVMEYVRGRSLRDILAEEQLLPERVAEITADAAAGLHYAHERGLVHRDVKPGNILVSDEGRGKVTDFGIARAVDAETMTQTAAVFGTAAYVAPEQAQGLAVDRRTDVYALGCVLYEMLTGRQPFTGDSAVSLAYQHVSQDPVPPRTLNPEISPEMEAVTLRAMAKAPADRYQTARDLRLDVERAARGLALATPEAVTQAVPVAVVEEPEEEPRRRSPLLIILALLTLAALGVGGFVLTNRNQPPAAPPLPIPDVAGLEVSQAETRLRGAGFAPEVGEPVFDASVPEGRVVRTDPPVNEVVAPGSAVTIVPSQGPPLLEVPDVTGRSADEAATALRRARLVVADVTERDSAQVDEGEVVGTNPAGGSRVRQGSRVTIVVSSGPPPFALPNVVDLTSDDAASRLQDACGQPPCVEIDRTESFSSSVEAGRVIRQNPSAESTVDRGQTVTLVISRGPQPQPSPSPAPTVTVSEPPTATPSETPSSERTEADVTPSASEPTASESAAATPTPQLGLLLPGLEDRQRSQRSDRSTG